ncbi:hypothetical protein DU195_23255 [Salmonella enterica subsp. enterica serovar Telhashomer]|nr:hypothetical protein [Salmonella enterica subsp. enterica serovar Miami]EBY0394588.1 hypothetical protein [Salmonella enterica subsp. enterica serovar Miami]EBY1787507.1 hypothetical protein [Salmonella enterica subsp. enterica serovar Telhashomer]ECA3525036.1 hypothetical protein [Salmonella enterica subsp. enterica serovar Telhashomer]
MGGADNANGDLPSYITGANNCASSRHPAEDISIRSRRRKHFCAVYCTCTYSGHWHVYVPESPSEARVTAWFSLHNYLEYNRFS